MHVKVLTIADTEELDCDKRKAIVEWSQAEQ